MMKKLALTLVLLLLAGPAAAALEVVATTPSMGMLARVVGGEAVTVTVLAPPDRDPHSLQARPSMMAALRRADLLVAVGAELEVGWLPAALQGAANPGINPGTPGYFEAAAQVELIEVGLPADRSLGDVHPMGNPHVNLDPERMAQVARALAGRLAALNPAAGPGFHANAERFAGEVVRRAPEWRRRAAGAPGIVLFHKDINYLAEFLEVPVLGYLEPVPGIPPTARHLRGLVENLENRRGVILHATYQPVRAGRFLSDRLGWPVHAVALEPPLGAGAAEYFALIDRLVAAVVSSGS